jgi:hypothetical protein
MYRLKGRTAVARNLDEIERFLLELDEGLVALGPAGSREVAYWFGSVAGVWA